jgi:5'-methylthioadenosine phosphorylase
MAKIAVIGGSGLDNPDILKNEKETTVPTRYGSVAVKEGILDGVLVILLARHGTGHETPPTQVNYRANILALKKLGVTHILAMTAVGSLREEIRPGDLVFPSQFIDWTSQRALTLHESAVVHTSLAEPYCPALRQLAAKVATELGIRHHSDKTLVVIEGPRFSTRAESNIFRALGADVINMSGVPEAQLAREAGICYLPVAMATDYDCWKEQKKPVTFEMVMGQMKRNAKTGTSFLKDIIPKIKDADCGCSAGMHPALKSQLEEPAGMQPCGKGDLASYIRTVPHFPKHGVMFRDVTTLFKDKTGFKLMIDRLFDIYKGKKIDKVVGIESRGFIIASVLAYRLGAGVVLARKPNKLPAEKISHEYELEYGKDRIEMHVDAIRKGERIAIVDDLIATGGTAQAVARLVEKLGGEIDSFAFVVDLPELGGKEKLKPHKIYTLVEFGGK